MQNQETLFPTHITIQKIIQINKMHFSPPKSSHSRSRSPSPSSLPSIPGLQNKKTTSQNASKLKAQQLQTISLDDQWLIQSAIVPKQLLICTVCLSIVNQPVECQKCQRLVCRTDYEQIREMKNCCPLCKASPWVVKQNMHIMYRQMFDLQIFLCKFCNPSDKPQYFSLSNLNKHLQLTHNSQIEPNSRPLKKYKFVVDGSSEQKILSFYQNLQINCQIYAKKKKIKILDAEFGQLKVDLGSMSTQWKNKNLGIKVKAKLVQIAQKKDDVLDKCEQKDYVVWEFDADGAFQYMLQEHQKLIEDSYQIYILQPAFEEIIIDVKGKLIRYLINFRQMTQTNVKTDFQRQIRRSHTIKFDEI